MVLEKLGNSLKNTLGKIAKSLFVDEKLVNELVKGIQKALLTSDVNVKLVFELTKKIKERALKEKLPKGLDKREHLVNIVYEELTNFLGKNVFEIKDDKLVVNKDNLFDCTLCEACTDLDPNIKLNYNDKEFIYYIESWGQLSCKNIVNEAINIFDERLDELSESLKKAK